jgi:hypothetical protein
MHDFTSQFTTHSCPYTAFYTILASLPKVVEIVESVEDEEKRQLFDLLVMEASTDFTEFFPTWNFYIDNTSAQITEADADEWNELRSQVLVHWTLSYYLIPVVFNSDGSATEIY